MKFFQNKGIERNICRLPARTKLTHPTYFNCLVRPINVIRGAVTPISLDDRRQYLHSLSVVARSRWSLLSNNVPEGIPISSNMIMD
jgi:hypothetical protein